jgi:hypothetical protein
VTYSEKPILTGAVPDSLFINITTVFNKLFFLQMVAAAYEDSKRMWSVEDVIRRGFHNVFAKIIVSPLFKEMIFSHSIKLPSFGQLFIGYLSWPLMLVFLKFHLLICLVNMVVVTEVCLNYKLTYMGDFLLEKL